MSDPVCEWMMYDTALTVDELHEKSGISKAEIRRQIQDNIKHGVIEREPGRHAWKITQE